MTIPNSRWLRAGALCCAALLSAVSIPAARAETLKVGGTGAALGTLRLLGEEFSRRNPTIQVEVLPYIGSTGAIKNVDGGGIDLGVSGRPLKTGEEKLDVRLSRYALTPLVIVSHPGVKLKSISRSDLAAVYNGQTTRWQNGSAVRLILRPAYETDNEVLRSMSPELSRALDVALGRPGMRYAGTDQDAADAIEQVPGAIGVSTLALVQSEKRQLGVLALDGVQPGIDTLKNGQYPYHKPLFLVTRSQPSPAVQALVSFIRSPFGQKLLTTNGQLPVTP